ncbi:Wzz/FepE/Etk N-terminal domain-containing protein [Sphingomonas sp. KR1UV-12]|uniref:Wzz/FepE/Etk N-terminal domain-containing protein n=1 Tax=Sphingomonas aurea TaxID=3063994 RepID=A0ABT9EJX9_9SPHN|nr:Wzz/FepE/Etk N-terminal domain-containing protein [Sphingomonas sp. KR1UV-12]MDP1027142.1 Wzz/FepE/Etk N-terminal domain-containing protein [Sphingomonas sp. KR1UV-12]
MSDGYAQDMENEGEGGGLIAYLPSILWARKWWIVTPLVVGTALGGAAALLMPPSYRSSATLLVESPQLPTELVAGQPQNSMIDRRIAKIRQQILSRPDLIELIESNNLYAEERQKKPLSEVLDKMRGATSISPVSADIGGGNGSNTIAFSLTFDYPEAQKAQVVAQDFVERLVKLDATQTAEQATGTVEFLQEQANNLTGQINAIERQIESIKLANGMTLSSSSMMMLGSGGGGNYQAQIAALKRENAQLQQALNQQSTATDRDPAVVNAEGALAAMRAVYSDSHPDVQAAQQRLVEARKFAQQNQTRFNAGSTIRSQMASNASAIANLEAAQNNEQARASAVVAAQAKGPAVQEQIAQLQAKADGLRINYQTIQTNLIGAKGSARISEQQRGERLTVIDPPVAPDKPNSPNRPLLIAGGLVAGGGLGLAIVLLLELIARPIRGVGPLQALTGEPPLVIVPKLSSTKTQVKERKWFKWPFRRKTADVAATTG